MSRYSKWRWSCECWTPTTTVILQLMDCNQAAMTAFPKTFSLCCGWYIFAALPIITNFCSSIWSNGCSYGKLITFPSKKQKAINAVRYSSTHFLLLPDDGWHQGHGLVCTLPGMVPLKLPSIPNQAYSTCQKKFPWMVYSTVGPFPFKTHLKPVRNPIQNPYKSHSKPVQN